MRIYCVECQSDIEPRLTNGEEIYPHRPDLHSLPFWKHDACGNYVGCHHKTAQPTKPLGVIPTPELKQARMKLHNAIDPIWKRGTLTRKKIYKLISDRLGYSYHSANIRSVEEAEKVLKIVDDYSITQ